MKILHIPFCYAPDPVGGTEVYVAALASELIKRGAEAVIAAPDAQNRSYAIDGVPVRRFKITQSVEDVSELYDDGDPCAAEEFARILDREKPDLVNLHAFTRAVSLRLVRACKSRRIPIVFTYHTPTVSCQRGIMMLWGRTPCDGRLDVRRCTGCTLQGLGLPQTIAKAASCLPASFGHRLGAWGLGGGPWTAMRMIELMKLRHASFFRMVEEVDHIVAVCDWVRDVILINGVAPKKVSVHRQGVSLPEAAPVSTTYPNAGPSGRATRFVFIGRFDPTKGLHVVINAFRKLPSLPMSLDVFGVAQSASNRAYEGRMKALARSDARIEFHPALPRETVIERLRDYDFLLAPSQWMETGPLVVLEAFAAGTPVIGYRVGGIAELVRDNVDGLLVDTGPRLAWANTLRRVTEDAGLQLRLKAGVSKPRTTADVADEMLTLYRSVLAAHPEKSFEVSAIV